MIPCIGSSGLEEGNSCSFDLEILADRHQQQRSKIADAVRRRSAGSEFPRRERGVQRLPKYCSREPTKWNGRHSQSSKRGGERLNHGHEKVSLKKVPSLRVLSEVQ